jgi:hypothetical protein
MRCIILIYIEKHFSRLIVIAQPFCAGKQTFFALVVTESHILRIESSRFRTMIL